jgi:hypothetical protein
MSNTFLFLKPILTPNALATVQANPILLAYMGLAIFGISVVISIACYTSWVTSKPYKKPKKGKDGKGGAPARGGASGGGIAGKGKNMLKGLRGRIGL